MMSRKRKRGEQIDKPVKMPSEIEYRIDYSGGRDNVFFTSSWPRVAQALYTLRQLRLPVDSVWVREWNTTLWGGDVCSEWRRVVDGETGEPVT